MKKTAKKDDLVTAIALETGYTKKDTENFIKATEIAIKKMLLTYDKVEWYGLQSWEVCDVEERKYRNPANGETITKEAHKTVRCKLKPSLKNLLVEDK